MSRSVVLTVDNIALEAEVPLAATLRQFLVEAKGPAGEAMLTDGIRALSPDLELAHRFQGATLSTQVPETMLIETTNLLVDELLVAAKSRG